jgi:2-methylcitrate dehydratase PrpD
VETARPEGKRTIVSEATTSILAHHVAALDFAGLPAAVRAQVQRLFLNWVGCALGGSTQAAVTTALAAVSEFAGPGEAGILGRSERLDALNAALINCMSSAVLTFDDTHLPSITHPGGPVASAALAVAERRPVGGREFVTAVALGVEASCRLGAMLTVPPASSNTSLFMTGIAGTIGSALAAGKLMRLDAEQLQRAIGLAVTQSAGLREMHGTMASSFVCGNAARAGLLAATFAKHGFTSGLCGIEGPKGYGNVFGNPACNSAVTDGLGSRHELLSLSYKPYPCGIAIHPVIDAARDILAQGPLCAEEIVSCEVTVHPVAVTLTGRMHPGSALGTQVSIPHWLAATLVRGRAGLDEATDECVRDPAVVALRGKVTLNGDVSMPPTGASVRIVMADGHVREAALAHCRGSVERPMTDDDLEEKFSGQAVPVIGGEDAARVAAMCWSIEAMQDVGAIARICAR